MVMYMGDNAMQFDFLIAQRRGDVIAAGFFEKSRIKVKSAGAHFGIMPLVYSYDRYQTNVEAGWSVTYARHSIGNKGRDFFYYCLAINKEVGTRYIVTTEELLQKDFYSFLMHNYKLPLLKVWAMPLFMELTERNCVRRPYYLVKECEEEGRTFPLNGQEVCFDDLIVYEAMFSEEQLELVVSDLLKKGKIKITEEYIPPLQFEGLDAYFHKYGHTIIENLESEVKPLAPLMSKLDEVALKHKRLLPQQAACIAGIRALRKSRVRYGIMNEGMGTGKTVQAASLADAYYIEEWLRKNPGKTVKDAYVDGVINYRVVIDCPGQLVEKWAREIQTEIPFAKVTILKDLCQLAAIRQAGRVPKNGKEFFVISKDLCKLGTQLSPIPTQVKTRYPAQSICKDCYEQENTVSQKSGYGGDAVCPECGGKHFMPHHIGRKASGMICPQCNELLLRYSKGKKMAWDQIENTEDGLVLQPHDFAQRNAGNSICYHCGAQLWGANSKPIDCGAVRPRHVQKWRKISFAKNKKGKTTETAFVLKGHEGQFLKSRGIEQYSAMTSEYGPRKVAPAHYIKKYLKGYFSLCILDEVHKFEGAGTAQSTAAHALIEASEFTVGLTGTISNGTAASFYYLLFMLEPTRMIERGFGWNSSDCMRFCQQYGCVESRYEGSEDGSYNSMSRGRQIGSPKVKPGISPLLFVDFLLDRCVFLDITDLSKYLPPLHEKVVTVELPEDISRSCESTILQLKQGSHSKEGRAVMSEMLQFGLSYPDKPFGRFPIKSAFVEDQIVAAVDNYEEYASTNTLLPKEIELVKIVNDEIAEGRSCFVYCTYTGKAETNITERLKAIIEDHCNLKNRVQVLQSSSPAPLKREEWIKKKAAEGYKVILTNPKCVETGLDFCFDHDGKWYNFPTLIFYQMSYEMSVIWQASRRAYRLNQKEECRTYYLAYEGTLQQAALSIMAEKQLATSAIQGKFSSEGLTAMAKGVDTRVQLAQALAKNDMGDRKTLENMFDALNQSNNEGKGEADDWVPPLTYYELVGKEEEDESVIDTDDFTIFDYKEPEALTVSEEPKVTAITRTVEKKVAVSTAEEDDPFAMFDEIFSYEQPAVTKATPKPAPVEKKKTKNTKRPAKTYGQFDLFEVFAS